MTLHPAFRRPLTAAVLGLATLFPILAAPQGAAASVSTWGAADARPVAGDVTAAALRYSGRTSQRRPVSVTVSNRRTRILRFSIDFRARCRNGSLNSGVITNNIAVRRGAFRAPGAATLPLDGGLTARSQINASGRVSRGAVAGTFRLTANITNAQGQTMDTCSTGTVRYRASRR